MSKKYTEVVYNRSYGGFGLSDEALMLYFELKGITVYPEEKTSYYNSLYLLSPKNAEDNSDREIFEPDSIERTDPILVEVVKRLKEKANGKFANLFIEKIPVGTFYRICEYDGCEFIEKMSDCHWLVA